MARGGQRKGAGRKAIGGECRKATLSIRVSEQTRDAARQLRAQGVDLGAELSELIRQLAALKK